jgi:hypothetical protein
MGAVTFVEEMISYARPGVVLWMVKKLVWPSPVLVQASMEIQRSVKFVV